MEQSQRSSLGAQRRREEGRSGVWWTNQDKPVNYFLEIEKDHVGSEK